MRGELEPEITARLLEARALAAAVAGDWSEAIELYQSALAEAPEEIAPEPLFRLYLLEGDTAKAHRFLQLNTSPLSARLAWTMQALVAALLGGEEVSKEVLNAPPAVADDPVLSLYWGLMLEAGGFQESSLPYLYCFLTSRHWGKELASKAILRHYQPICRMCREAEAQTYDDSVPLCRACADRMADQLWKDQAIYAPTMEQERLLQNAWGPVLAESLRDIHRVNTPVQMHSEIPYTPQLPLLDLLERLDSDSQQAWESAQAHARQDRRCYRGVKDLAIALGEKSLESGLFQRKKMRMAAFREAKALEPDPPGQEAESSDELLWLLQIARWKAAFQPPFEERITVHHLWRSYQLTLPHPGWVYGNAVYLLIGSRLGADQSDYFESLSAEKPDDVFLHLALSGRSRFDFRPLLAERRLRHSLWLIEHRPTTQSGGLDPTDFEGVRAKTEAWIRQIEKHQDEPAVLGAAAQALEFNNPDLARALIRRCLHLQPDNKQWVEWLEADDDFPAPSKPDTRTPDKELAEAEAALAEDPETYGSARLAEVALLAYKAGSTERAREVSSELVGLVETQDDEFSGFAFHIGHTVSGLLAFDEGDYKRAEDHLIQSGSAWKSSLFGLLGPSMSLAKALLDVGQTEVVLSYLESCKAFWDARQLDLWKQEIEEGKKPDFGPNLRL